MNIIRSTTVAIGIMLGCSASWAQSQQMTQMFVQLPALCGGQNEWTQENIIKLGGVNPWFLMKSLDDKGEVAAFTNGDDVVMLFFDGKNEERACGVLFKGMSLAPPPPQQREAQQ